MSAQRVTGRDCCGTGHCGRLNTADPDLVVVAGDITDDGYPDQYPIAKDELSAIACRQVVFVPGNHDARNVGYLGFEDTFGNCDLGTRLRLAGLDVAVVAVDVETDLDQGEIGREHYGWIQEGFAGPADLRVFACHHHLMPIPGTGRERNQVLDAGDALSLLRHAQIDVVRRGPPPRALRVAGSWHAANRLGHCLHAAHPRLPAPAYNLIRIEAGRISETLRVRGGEERSLGAYPRGCPWELSRAPSRPLRPCPTRGSARRRMNRHPPDGRRRPANSYPRATISAVQVANGVQHRRSLGLAPTVSVSR